MSIVEDVEKLIWDVERRPSLYNKNWKNTATIIWRINCGTKFTSQIGLEVNAGKTKYKVMSSDQNAGESHDIKIDNSCFERVEHFRCLRTSLTNQNYIKEGNKCRLKSQNACYRSVQNLLSSSLLPKNLKIKVYRTTVFLLFCKGVKLGENKRNTTRLPLLTHSRNCYTCNEISWKKYPCWQETNVTFYHTARELTLVAKWNTLRNTLLQQCL